MASVAIDDRDQIKLDEANLIAALALRGFTVHLAPDGYLVTRWGMTRHCPDLVTLTAFAKQVGVPQ